MGLIHCYECGDKISTSAAACPKCGAPNSGARVGTPLATTQLTSKRLKGHILIAAILFWGGLALSSIPMMLFATDPINANKEPPESIMRFSGIGGLCFMVGFIWYIVTKLRIWWHHK